MAYPIVLYSALSGRFYVTRSYKQTIIEGKLVIRIVGRKYDVTDSVYLALKEQKAAEKFKREHQHAVGDPPCSACDAFADMPGPPFD